MTDANESEFQIDIEVTPLDDDRQIAWGEEVVTRFQDRAGDISRALQIGAESLSRGLSELTIARGWGVDEITLSFGLVLTGEAGVVIKASAAGTLAVTMKFARDEED